jgi:hypothetical protein
MNNMSKISVPVDLHDAELHALHHDSKFDVLECAFRTSSGDEVVLALQGATRFRCTDFGRQNVVLELIVVSSAEDMSREMLFSNLKWMASTSEDELLSSRQEIDEEVNQVLKGAKCCVILIPSWGARLIALASGVEWR